MDAQPTGSSPAIAKVPWYLAQVYSWAYVDSRAIHFFERQWLVNLILWGNFARLRDEALAALGQPLDGRSLQIACVYGDLTGKLLARVAPDGTLDVVDVLPLQLENLHRKLPANHPVRLRPGGRIVVVDYHRPHPLHPLYWPMKGILHTLEPFALDLWESGIEAWLPHGRPLTITRRTMFGGLYQLVTLTPQ